MSQLIQCCSGIFYLCGMCVEEEEGVLNTFGLFGGTMALFSSSDTTQFDRTFINVSSLECVCVEGWAEEGFLIKMASSKLQWNFGFVYLG